MGNGDAIFLSVVIKGALAGWYFSGVVIDLRKMHYTFGDAITNVIDNDRVRRPFQPFPTAIVVSDLNRVGMTSLFREVMRKSPEEWLFDSLEEALHSVESQHEKQSREPVQARPGPRGQGEVIW